MKVKELEKYITMKKESSKLFTQKLIARLDTLSPLKTLARGYAIAEMGGKTIKLAKDLKLEDIIDLRFTDGKKKAKITK